MTLFWWSAGLLLALTLVWLLAPLIFPAHRRPCLPSRDQLELLQAQRLLRERGEIDEAQWQTIRDGLTQRWLEEVDAWLDRPQRLLQGWPLAVVLAFVIPLVGWQLYQRIGSPALIPILAQSAPPAQTDGNTPDSPEALRARLEERVEVNPGDVEAWVLLARMEHENQQFEQAEGFYLKALEAAPEEPLILVELAENRLFAGGKRTFDDQARQWLRDALTLDPQNQKALWLLGLDAQQHEQWALAIQYWETLLPQLDAGSSVWQAVRKQLLEVYPQAGQPVPQHLQEAAPPPSLALRIRVELDEALRDALPPNPVLFVFARATEGPPMPVAAIRAPVTGFPLELTLDDSHSLTPQRKLSDLPGWIIAARIASEGQARGQQGSLEAPAVHVDREQSGDTIVLRIREVRH